MFAFCVLADIVHFIKILILCNTFFAFPRRNFSNELLSKILTSSVIGIVSAVIYLYNNHFIETVLYVITVILLLCILYREQIHSVIVATLWMLIVLSMIDTMTFILFDITMELFNINGESISNLVVSLITLLFIYVVGRIYKKYTSLTFKLIGVANLTGFIVLLAIDTFVVTVMAPPNVNLYMEDKRIIYLWAVVFVIVGIFIQLAAVILLFTQRNVYKEKEELTDKYLNEQKNHYEYLENREIETKKFRHDLRSHMELISNMARNHEYDKIDEYIEQMHERIDTFGNLITVQNSIVDAIINQYYARAEQKGVTMEVRGRFPVDCNIDTYDLCTIFSNVLSNALEAAQETEEKYISVECGYTDKSIIIVVKNSFHTQTKSGNAQWRTQKGNTDYHGYGLENIKDSVKRYNGVFDIETNDNMFTVKILFNNRK